VAGHDFNNLEMEDALMVRAKQVLRSLVYALIHQVAQAGPFPPVAGQPGSTAIAYNDPQFVAWATSVQELTRGPMNIANPGAGLASFGAAANALGPAGTDTSGVVSLGDGGHVTLGFAQPIANGPGADFAVFENSFADTFLELAFVEVSSDGVNFFRFPGVSLTQAATQVGGFGTLDPTNLNDLAGKYRVGFGTPFDLDELAGVSGLLDVNAVEAVRIVDVVGSIDPLYGTHDSLGNIVNDPWPTAFASGGFDLDAVGVIHPVPEPATWILCAIGTAIIAYSLPRVLVRRSNLRRCRVVVRVGVKAFVGGQ
jgi:hypothetical protein